MKISLPEDPIDLYEVVFYVVFGDEIRRWKYVYHVAGKWEDNYPGHGNDFVHEWHHFEGERFDSRCSGWNSLAKNFPYAYASKEEARAALVKNLRAALARAERNTVEIRTKLTEMGEFDVSKERKTCRTCGTDCGGAAYEVPLGDGNAWRAWRDHVPPFEKPDYCQSYRK